MRELLAAERGLAIGAAGRSIPVMWFPDDEARAVDAVRLLLAHGVDPSIKNKDGLTAADIAWKRGLYDAEAMLRSGS